jgi:hypothetical protein
MRRQMMRWMFQHAALTVGLFTMPSQFSRGLVHPAISLPCLCETEGVKSPILTEWAFLVHWRRRGYTQSSPLYNNLHTRECFCFIDARMQEWVPVWVQASNAINHLPVQKRPQILYFADNLFFIPTKTRKEHSSASNATASPSLPCRSAAQGYPCLSI